MQIEIEVGPNRGWIKQMSWLNPSEQEALDKLLSAEDEGASFISAATKARQAREDQDGEEGGQPVWDGVYHLLTKAGRFPAGLVTRVRRALESYGHFVTVTDLSPQYQPERPEVTFPEGWQLEPEQEQAVEAMLRVTGPRRGVLSSPPRSGKTIMAAEMLRRLNLWPAVFLLERLDIAQPPRGAVQKFQDYLGHGLTIGHAYDGEFVPGELVVLTIQTACAALGIKREKTDEDIPEQEMSEERKEDIRQLLKAAKVVTVDEAHHSQAISYRAVIRYCTGRAVTWGVSGTYWSDSGMELFMEGAVGPVVHEITYKQMIDRGRLVPAHIYLTHMPEKQYYAKLSYAARRQDYIHESPLRNLAITTFVRQMVEMGKSCLVVVDHISHMRIIDNRLKTEGVPHTCMSASGRYKVDPRKRGEVWEKFQNKEIMVLVSTLGQEGMDLPSLCSVVMAAGGASSVRCMQRMRCLTASPGKEAAYILEFMDKAKYFSDHSAQRLRVYTRQPAGVFFLHQVVEFQHGDESWEKWVHSRNTWKELFGEEVTSE